MGFYFLNIAYFYILMSFVRHYIITSRLNDKKHWEIIILRKLISVQKRQRVLFIRSTK